MTSINRKYNSSENDYIIDIIEDFENMKVHFDVINKIINLTNSGTFIKFEPIVKNGLSRLSKRVKKQEKSLKKWETNPTPISLRNKNYNYREAAIFFDKAKKNISMVSKLYKSHNIFFQKSKVKNKNQCEIPSLE